MLRDSSSGLTPDGRVKPELLCPGYKVRSACSDGDLASTQQARLPELVDRYHTRLDKVRRAVHEGRGVSD